LDYALVILTSTMIATLIALVLGVRIYSKSRRTEHYSSFTRFIASSKVNSGSPRKEVRNLLKSAEILAREQKHQDLT